MNTKFSQHICLLKGTFTKLRASNSYFISQPPFARNTVVRVGARLGTRKIKERGLISVSGQVILSSKFFRPVPGQIGLFSEYERGHLPRKKNGLGVNLPTHFHLLSSLKLCGTLPTHLKPVVNTFLRISYALNPYFSYIYYAVILHCIFWLWIY
jgi:hypothetical protein